uniref:Nicotianamine synthase n=1 Tax=Tanacetum cinerariifolium TaxID=118510 RepID=A0A6L2K5F2_TANCI|nr:nicotianamine synthase-like [Tanacetum cinerariifolium]
MQGVVPKRVAFVGSGPLPLTSILLASFYLKDTYFHNYDIDHSANSLAASLIAPDRDLSKRMFFHSTDIMEITDELEYDVVFLAALVVMDISDKVEVIQHLAKYMAPGAILMLRSAHGARAFLYPVVEPEDLQGFKVLSIFHPFDDVINSVMIARKYPLPNYNDIDDHNHPRRQLRTGSAMLPSTKNKIGSIDCSCKRSSTDDILVMDMPLSPNHEPDFPADDLSSSDESDEEFKEDPQDEPEEEEDPQEEPEEDNVNYLARCEKKRQAKMDANNFEIRKVKRRMDDFDQDLGHEAWMFESLGWGAMDACPDDGVDGSAVFG